MFLSVRLKTEYGCSAQAFKFSGCELIDRFVEFVPEQKQSGQVSVCCMPGLFPKGVVLNDRGSLIRGGNRSIIKSKHFVPGAIVESVRNLLFRSVNYIANCNKNNRKSLWIQKKDSAELFKLSNGAGFRLFEILGQSQAQFSVSYQRMVRVIGDGFDHATMTIKGQSPRLDDRDFPLNFPSRQRITERHWPTSFLSYVPILFFSLTRRMAEG